MVNTKFNTVDEYISTLPSKSKNLMKSLRKAIQQAAPQAEELISYNMPAFRLNGVLVYYAAFDKHIGFYPTPSGIEKFKKELSSFKWAKGSVQFPINRPIPYDLVKKIVKFRVEENLGNTNVKKNL